MRSFRQIIHGCKKHHYRLFREVRWWEDEYHKGKRTMWICINCMHISHMEMRIHALRNFEANDES